MQCPCSTFVPPIFSDNGVSIYKLATWLGEGIEVVQKVLRAFGSAGSGDQSRSVTGFAARRCDHNEKVLREYYREAVSEAAAAKYWAMARNRFNYSRDGQKARPCVVWIGCGPLWRRRLSYFPGRRVGSDIVVAHTSTQRLAMRVMGLVRLEILRQSFINTTKHWRQKLKLKPTLLFGLKTAPIQLRQRRLRSQQSARRF